MAVCSKCNKTFRYLDPRHFALCEGEDTNFVGSPLDVQEGGNHYKDLKIQPIEYIFANNLGFAEGSVIKYVTRYKNKNGIEDLKKARHFIDLLIEDLSKNSSNESDKAS